MKISIQYDDGLVLAEHSIGQGDAAAWQALFENAAATTTKYLGTPADTRAREFARDLLNATNAAEMGLESRASPDPPEQKEDRVIQTLDKLDHLASTPERWANRALRPAGSHLRKLITGGYGLAKTYWLFGGITSSVGLTSLSLEVPAITMSLFPYWVMVGIGIWRAASKHQGRAIWARLAKINEVCVIAILLAIVVLMLLNL